MKSRTLRRKDELSRVGIITFRRRHKLKSAEIITERGEQTRRTKHQLRVANVNHRERYVLYSLLL